MAELLRWYHIGRCFVEVWPDAVATYFPDGARLVAGPDESKPWLPWADCVEHEIAHTWLAAVYGLPWSPALWRTAHGDWTAPWAREMAAVEEEAALAFCRGMDDQAPPRPWDLYSLAWHE